MVHSQINTSRRLYRGDPFQIHGPNYTTFGLSDEYLVAKMPINILRTWWARFMITFQVEAKSAFALSVTFHVDCADLTAASVVLDARTWNATPKSYLFSLTEITLGTLRLGNPESKFVIQNWLNQNPTETTRISTAHGQPSSCEFWFNNSKPEHKQNVKW